MICAACREPIPDDAPVIETPQGENLCEACHARHSNPYARTLLRPYRSEEEQEARDRSQNKRV